MSIKSSEIENNGRSQPHIPHYETGLNDPHQVKQHRFSGNNKLIHDQGQRLPFARPILT